MRALIVEPAFEANKTRIQEYVDSHRFYQVLYVRTIPTAVPVDGAKKIFILHDTLFVCVCVCVLYTTGQPWLFFFFL